ncbi:hypothetical protein VB711_20915 [Cronbergia sp. UHCC 0137]|uniref:hypothetical protein n=1 Tax=Cronbergia sp. UHCC 0137 TaxID=3110239 RepID=UPI002B211B60|nr:hypothetical protein [Cronbergia sp. UHCC 0137]MEA5620288.1 hypothetical protein [Cronbergia sp. UHCC 0137]
MVNKNLINAFIDQLLDSTTEEKLAYEATIIELLGGDQNTKVTNLPKRRGRSDGGIDGRIKVIAPQINKVYHSEGLSFQKGNNIIQDAGISIKIQTQKFTREQFGGFKDDLERENLYIGIIISATGLSPDAQRRIDDVNIEGIYQFIHIPLGDILAGNINLFPIQLADKNICDRIVEYLNKMS